MTEKGFEKDLKRMEEIVSILEGGEATLEESMKLFEEGVKLSRRCSDRLDKAEKKVEILVKDKKGDIKAEPFETG